MNKIITAAAAAAIMACVTACSDEVVNTSADASETYTREFVKTFGVPDPDHTWNMAGRVTVDASGYARTTTVSVYDKAPGAEGAHIVARIQGGSSVEVDYPSDKEYIYFTVTASDGSVLFNGSRQISGGTAYLATSASRDIDGDWVSPAYFKQWGTKNLFGDITFTNQDCIDYLRSRGVLGATSTTMDVSRIFWFYKLVYNTGKYADISPQSATPGIRFDSNDEGLACSDLVSLVGTKGVFHEQVSSDGKCNLSQYWNKLNPEDGVTYDTNGGAVYIDWMYGCGKYRNAFGYFYYKKEDTNDPLKVISAPKYILMYDASPWSNLQRKESDEDTWSTFDDGGTDRINNIGMQPGEDIEAYEDDNTKDVRFRGAKYQLYYYEQEWSESDKKYNVGTEPFSEFPAGYEIGFFILCEGNYFLEEVINSTTSTPSVGYISANNIRFSIPWMNDYLGQTFIANHNGCKAMSAPEHTPWFVSYQWGDRTVMGVEDGQYGYSDHDMNDILFEIRGAEPTIEPLKVTTEATMQKWIVACEDLGSTDDYDFNDIVFGVSQVITTTGEDQSSYIIVTPLASGGTLKAKVYLNGEPLEEADKYWHEYFDGINSHTTVVNATGDASKAVDATRIKIPVSSDFTLTSSSFREGGNMGGFSVRIFNNDGTPRTDSPEVTPPSIGEVPQMILLPGDWSWPREGVAIHDAYPDTNYNGLEIPGFAQWVTSSRYNDWLRLPTELNYDKVYQNNWEGEPFPGSSEE